MNENVDGFGIHGLVLAYATIFTFVGTAFILFLFFWKKGRLDMDEEPKMQMLREEKQDE